MRLNETRFGPKKSRPQYISAQKISTLFDALDEREGQIIFRCASIHGRAGFILDDTLTRKHLQNIVSLLYSYRSLNAPCRLIIRRALVENNNRKDLTRQYELMAMS